jgi:hypothetical protein
MSTLLKKLNENLLKKENVREMSSGDSRNIREPGQNFGGNSINPTSEYSNILKG